MTNNTNNDKPTKNRKISNGVIILKLAKVTPSKIMDSPPANVMFPSQSIFSFLITPKFFEFNIRTKTVSRKCAYGTLTQKT